MTDEQLNELFEAIKIVPLELEKSAVKDIVEEAIFEFRSLFVTAMMICHILDLKDKKDLQLICDVLYPIFIKAFING